MPLRTRVWAAIGLLLWSIWLIMIFVTRRRARRVAPWLAIGGAMLIVAVMLAMWIVLEPKQ